MLMSGPVAVIGPGGSVDDVIDLGDAPVEVPYRALPIIDIRPTLESGEFYSGYTFVLSPTQVNRVWIKSPVSSEVISDRQFFQQLAIVGMITEQEALDAVGSGQVPASLAAAVDQLPEVDRFNAMMLLRGATEFRRHHHMTDAIRQLMGITDDAVDSLWASAAQL